MESKSRRGKAVNQFEIELDNGDRVFQSYETTIARIDKAGQVTLDRAKWDYSKTTGLYRNRFLGEDKATTESKIKSGVYKLADLNA
jgi:hypothetical protein